MGDEPSGSLISDEHGIRQRLDHLIEELLALPDAVTSVLLMPPRYLDAFIFKVLESVSTRQFECFRNTLQTGINAEIVELVVNSAIRIFSVYNETSLLDPLHGCAVTPGVLDAQCSDIPTSICNRFFAVCSVASELSVKQLVGAACTLFEPFLRGFPVINLDDGKPADADMHDCFDPAANEPSTKRLSSASEVMKWALEQVEDEGSKSPDAIVDFARCTSRLLRAAVVLCKQAGFNSLALPRTLLEWLHAQMDAVEAILTRPCLVMSEAMSVPLSRTELLLQRLRNEHHPEHAVTPPIQLADYEPVTFVMDAMLFAARTLPSGIDSCQPLSELQRRWPHALIALGRTFWGVLHAEFSSYVCLSSIVHLDFKIKYAELTAQLEDVPRCNVDIVGIKRKMLLQSSQDALEGLIRPTKRGEGLLHVSHVQFKDDQHEGVKQAPKVWCSLVAKALVEKSARLFHQSGGHFAPCYHPHDTLTLRASYRFCGRFIAIAIDQHEEVQLPLAVHICKALLGLRPSWTDLRAFDRVNSALVQPRCLRRHAQHATTQALFKLTGAPFLLHPLCM